MLYGLPSTNMATLTKSRERGENKRYSFRVKKPKRAAQSSAEVREARRRHRLGLDAGQAERGSKAKGAPNVELPPVGDSSKTAVGTGEVMEPVKGSVVASGTFDLSGNWMSKRAEVKQVLGLDKAPASKAAARELLENAGYNVEE